jgi:hypothetical protein
MFPGRVEISHRNEHEAPLVQTGVRDRQIGLVDDTLSVKEDIEIERAGPPAVILVAPEGPLNFPADRHQATRGEAGVELHHAVQKPP